MRKLFLVVVLVLGCAAWSFAEDASITGNDAAVELKNSGVIAAEDVADIGSSIDDLVKNGATMDEAKNVVSQAVKQAKADGLTGKDLSAKVHEAVKAAKEEKAAQSEHPKETQSEHPKKDQSEHPKASKSQEHLKSSDKPKDHPAH